MNEEKNLNRRNFLGAATVVIGGFIGVSLGIPSLIYLTGPATRKTDSENWIRLGSTAKIEIGAPTLFKVKVQHQAGWIVDEEEISVYVITQNGRDYIAMSNICTHLGCRVRWISDQSQFFCPCHNAIFDEEGQVVSGPPPRPLDRYETKVENKQIFIKVG